jgi:hypothetical protein
MNASGPSCSKGPAIDRNQNVIGSSPYRARYAITKGTEAPNATPRKRYRSAATRTVSGRRRCVESLVSVIGVPS